MLGWMNTQRPTVLISEIVDWLCVLTENVCAMYKEKGAGFVAAVSVENDDEVLYRSRAFELWSNNKNRIYHRW